MTTTNPEDVQKFLVEHGYTPEGTQLPGGSTSAGGQQVPTPEQAGTFSSPNTPMEQPAKPQEGLPTGYQGGSLGPNNEALPPGASTFNPYGQPVFSPAQYEPGLWNDIKNAVTNYWSGVLYRTSKPTEPQVPLSEGIAPDSYADATRPEWWQLIPGYGAVRTVTSGKTGVAVQALGNAVHNIQNVPGAIGNISRWVSEGIQGIGELFAVSANTTERALGTAHGVIFEHNTLDEAYQASRIAYESFLEPAVREEYIRRYRAGENPIFLAQELSKGREWKDLAGKLVLDPLNLFAVWSKLAKLSGTEKAAAELVTVSETSKGLASRNIAIGLKELEAAELQKGADLLKPLQSVAEATKVQAAEAASEIADTARKIGFTAPTAEAKAYHYADMTHNATVAAMRAVPVAEQAQVIKDWVVAGDPLTESMDRAEAIYRLSRYSTKDVFLSPNGVKAAQTMGSWLRQDGKFSKTRIQALEGLIKEAQTQTAQSPLAYLADGLIKHMKDSIKLTFPSVRQMAANADKAEKLLAEGQPIPSYLAPFIQNGKVIPVSPGLRKLANAERVMASIKNPVNKLLASVYLNTPAFITRNYQNNLATMFADYGFLTVIKEGGLGSIMNAGRAERNLNDWIGAPTAQAEKLFGGMGTEMAAPNVANALIGFAGKAENRAAKVVVWTGFKKTMDRAFKVIYKGLDDGLDAAGLKAEHVADLKQMIYDAKGDVPKALARFMSTNQTERRNIAFLGDDLVKQLQKEGLTDEVTRILQTSKGDTPEEVLARLDQLRAERRLFADNVYLEEAIPAPESPVMKEILDVEDEALKRWGLDLGKDTIPAGNLPDDVKQVRGYSDLLSRRQSQAWAMHNQYQFAASEAAAQAHATGNAGAKDAWQKAMEQVRQVKVAEGQETLAAQAKTIAQADKVFGEAQLAAKAGEAEKAAALRHEGWQIWHEYKRMGGIRDKLHMKYRDMETSAYQKFLKEMNPADTTQMDMANQMAEETKLWDKADEQYFFQTGLVRVKKTGEPIAGALPPEKQVPDQLLAVPQSDTMAPTPPRAAHEGFQGFSDLIDQVKDGITQYWTQIDKPGEAFTGAQKAAIEQFGKSVGERMANAKAIAMEVGDAARKFTLLDYSDKKTFDVALSYVMPYHYWYTRTYANWIKRVAADPHLLAAYAMYRDTLSKVHAGMPDWWKYNINSNELLGMDSENPLFFNLEASINPVNSLTGIDFNDPGRQATWVGSMLDNMGKFGPSIWTPLTLGYGAYLAATGDQAGAESFLGRSIPFTQVIKSATGMLGFKGTGSILTPGGVELDPSMILQGGMGKYDRNRVGRMLGQMQQEGLITPAQAQDAAYQQSGDVWNEAWSRAESARAPGNLLAGVAGVGFRGRNPQDVVIDQFFSEMSGLNKQRDNLSPDEYAHMWNVLEERYPFMDTVLLSRRGDDTRDQALVYTVLGRIPPGQQTDYAKSVGLDPRLLDEFYQNKGFRSSVGTNKYGGTLYAEMNVADKERVMSAIRSLGAVLAVPADTTRHEWNLAKEAYTSMNLAAKQYFGPNILDETDSYYSLKDDANKADAFLGSHPEVQQYLDWKGQAVLGDPILNKYYGGIDFLEGTLRRDMYRYGQETYGKDIFDLQSAFYDIKDQNGDTTKFLADHPQLQEWWNYKAGEEGKIAAELEKQAQYFPETPKAAVRPDANLQSIGAQDVMQALQAQTQSDPNHDALVAAYTKYGGNTVYKIGIQNVIDQNAEKMWPNVLDKVREFDNLSATSPALAQQYYAKHKDLQQYIAYEKAMKKQYNAVQAQKPVQQQPIDWQQTLGPTLYRLVKDAQRGQELPKVAQGQLSSIADQLGISVDSLVDLVP